MKSTAEKYGNEPVCQNGTANFAPTELTDQRGPPPEVVPNDPVGRNEKIPTENSDIFGIMKVPLNSINTCSFLRSYLVSHFTLVNV